MTKVHDIFRLGDEHQVPVGGSFAPSAWIAPFVAGHVYAVGWIETNLAQLVKDSGAGLPTALEAVDEETEQPYGALLAGPDGSLFDEAQESQKGKFKYYYRDRDRALVLTRLLDTEEPAYTRAGKKFSRKPEHRFRLEAAVANVLTLSEDAKGKFKRPVVSWEVELKAAQKDSPDWFSWHGLMLPSIVSAYAQLMKFKADPLNLDEFFVPGDEFIVTDPVQELLIGNTDVGFENSKLWLRRKLLWSQLGEDNPKISNPDDTESEQLKAAFRIAASDWLTPVYCKVIRVPSPRVDDVWTGQSGRVRNRIPVIMEFYPNEAAARKAAEAELAERGMDTGNDGRDSSPDPSGPVVPEAWAEIPNDWKETVRTIKVDIGTKPLLAVKKALHDRAEQLASEYMVTPDDVLAWWNEV